MPSAPWRLRPSGCWPRGRSRAGSAAPADRWTWPTRAPSAWCCARPAATSAAHGLTLVATLAQDPIRPVKAGQHLMSDPKICLFDKCRKPIQGLRADAKYCSHGCSTKAAKRRIRLRNGLFVGGLERGCEDCGKPFQAAFTRHAFCSEACAKTSYAKRNQQARRTTQCGVCAEEFAPVSSTQRFCSDSCLSVRRRQRRLVKKYGLTQSSFEALLEQQGGACAICRTNDAGRWVVDHDHSCCGPGSSCGSCIRGILCLGCNTALGLFKDSQESLSRAVNYLARSTACQALNSNETATPNQFGKQPIRVP